MQQQFITAQHLQQLGITIAENDAVSLLEHLNNQLQERIGASIAESLDDEKLQQLLDLQDGGDDEAVGTWLDANVEDLQQIAEDERDILLGELAENTDSINTSK